MITIFTQLDIQLIVNDLFEISVVKVCSTLFAVIKDKEVDFDNVEVSPIDCLHQFGICLFTLFS